MHKTKFTVGKCSFPVFFLQPTVHEPFSFFFFRHAKFLSSSENPLAELTSLINERDRPVPSRPLQSS
jgi:hypothetical protein